MEEYGLTEVVAEVKNDKKQITVRNRCNCVSDSFSFIVLVIEISKATSNYIIKA